jgi:hypothetical protein
MKGNMFMVLDILYLLICAVAGRRCNFNYITSLVAKKPRIWMLPCRIWDQFAFVCNLLFMVLDILYLLICAVADRRCNFNYITSLVAKNLEFECFLAEFETSLLLSAISLILVIWIFWIWTQSELILDEGNSPTRHSQQALRLGWKPCSLHRVLPLSSDFCLYKLLVFILSIEIVNFTNRDFGIYCQVC